MNKTYTITLEEDEATMVWWALKEKETQLNTRIAEFKHINFPPEVINSNKWEAVKLAMARAKLDDLGRDSTT